jgi:hypothetical protein
MILNLFTRNPILAMRDTNARFFNMRGANFTERIWFEELQG